MYIFILSIYSFNSCAYRFQNVWIRVTKDIDINNAAERKPTRLLLFEMSLRISRDRQTHLCLNQLLN